MIFVFTLLAFALVFYLLMRWGCGMEVAEGEGHTLEHAGRTWSFCSLACRERFGAREESP